jgi:hypothetical protein
MPAALAMHRLIARPAQRDDDRVRGVESAGLDDRVAEVGEARAGVHVAEPVEPVGDLVFGEERWPRVYGRKRLGSGSGHGRLIAQATLKTQATTICQMVAPGGTRTIRPDSRRRSLVGRRAAAGLPVLVAVLLLVACGGSSGVSISSYLDGWCTAFGSFLAASRTGTNLESEFEAAFSEGDLEQAKAVVVSYVDDIEAAAEALREDLVSLGVPEGQDGERVAEAMERFGEATVDLYAQAAEDARAISTASDEQFAEDFGAWAARLDSDPLADAVSTLEGTDDEYQQAFDDSAICQRVDDRFESGS